MKKKVVIYGNCHTEAITALLKTVPEFNDKYEILPVLPIQNIKDSSYLESSFFTECDIFIHQSIWKKNRYGEEFASENIIQRLKPDCRVIAIPNVYHMPMCFFPNYSSEKEFTFLSGTTCFFRDKIIDSQFLERKSNSEIVDVYQSDNLFSSDLLDSLFHDFIAKVKKREKDWDIPVSNYILNNFQKQKLFFDPNHPTNYFFAYVVWKLLEIMGISYKLEKLYNGGVRELDTFEMPMCQSVKNHFGMTFAENELRKTGAKVKSGKMMLENYIDQYCSLEWQNKIAPTDLRVKSFIKWSEYKMERYMGKLKR